VEYERNALHRGAKRFGLRAVALQKSNLQPLKPTQLPEISYEAGYGIPFFEKPFDEMTPDKAGSARDQYPS